MIRKKILKVLGLIAVAAAITIAGGFKAQNSYAAGDYCADQRKVNQWSCDHVQIDLCVVDPPPPGECPSPNDPWACENDKKCLVWTDMHCKVINADVPCTTNPCQTEATYNDCEEGADWKSSCITYNTEYKECWVLAYSCNDEGACVRDVDDGTYYDNGVCNNECVASCPKPNNVDIKVKGSDGPVNVAINETFTVSWSSDNADSCSVKEEGVQIATSTSGSTSRSFSTSGTKAYTFDCTNDCGTRSDTVQVNVSGSPPTCTVSGPTSVDVTIPAEYCVTPSDAPLGAEIWKSPKSSQTWTNVRPKIPGYGCNFTSFDQTGYYYVICNAFGSAGAKCSGNPWCEWLPNPPNTDNCTASGWTDCTANDVLVVNVTQPGPWWQVKDADVTTNGDLISRIPDACSLPACNPVFGLKGVGGFPGVPAYLGTADFSSGAGTGQATEGPNWLAKAGYYGKTYDYAYFKRKIPSDIDINELTLPAVTGGTFTSGGTPSKGYIWYHWDGAVRGDLTIQGKVIMPGSRKVVLMVEKANLTIENDIKLVQPGRSFFMAVVGKRTDGYKGNILVDPAAKNLEGIFLAESEFKTGAGSDQLNVRGSVVAYEGVSLERNLGDSNPSTPAEFFEYAPDIIAHFPIIFAEKTPNWEEVAP